MVDDSHLYVPSPSIACAESLVLDPVRPQGQLEWCIISYPSSDIIAEIGQGQICSASQESLYSSQKGAGSITDLNPTENIWRHMQALIAKDYAHITSRGGMIRVVQDLWDSCST